MGLVNFIHRSDIPNSPQIGSFYWVDSVDGVEIWFSPTDSKEDMILLNQKFDSKDIEEIISRLSGTDSDLEDIHNLLNELRNELNNYWGKQELTKVSQLENDSKYITEDEFNVGKLTWKII